MCLKSINALSALWLAIEFSNCIVSLFNDILLHTNHGELCVKQINPKIDDDTY